MNCRFIGKWLVNFHKHAHMIMPSTTLIADLFIYYYSRPGAHTTKYNQQWDNLLMGHVQAVHG